MALRLYNSYSKSEQELVPRTVGEVTMYTCGPTVYGRPHIGNYSSFLMADLLRRWLQFGHQLSVKHVKNITDVGHLIADADEGDDKVEKEARAEKLDPLKIAARYTEQYLADEVALNMLDPLSRPRATAYIKDMLAIIKTLMEKGCAYELPDGIYFSVESFKNYGKLSGNTLATLDSGARIEVNEQKKHPADFALWKKCVGNNNHHILRWSFATGDRTKTEGDDASSGFPGWHIECSAMASTLLGEQIDIHTGGEDNIFPHHECEIAQSECAFGKQPFAKLWLHKRRIDLKGEKMSKSLGNVLTLPSVVEKGYSPLDLRFYLLSVHYRTNLKFTWDGLDGARDTRRSITEWMEKQSGGVTNQNEKSSKKSSASDIQKFTADFRDAMDADLNVSAALAAVHECMSYMNSHSAPTADTEIALKEFIDLVRNTFGCFEAEAVLIPAAVQALAAERLAARAAKDFAESDRLRDEIAKLGWMVRDTKGEQELRKI